jgi:hypothetical protein
MHDTIETGAENVICSFCGNSQDQVRTFVRSQNVFICDECVFLCLQITSETGGLNERAAYITFVLSRNSYTRLPDGFICAKKLKLTRSPGRAYPLAPRIRSDEPPREGSMGDLRVRQTKRAAAFKSDCLRAAMIA